MNCIALFPFCPRLFEVHCESSNLWCQIHSLQHLRLSDARQLVERICGVENHQLAVDDPYSDTLISEKVQNVQKEQNGPMVLQTGA